MDFIEVSAKNVDEAITKACIALGVSSDRLDIQVVSEGSSGFLGFGSKPAVIKAKKKEEPEVKAEEKAEEKPEEPVQATKDIKEGKEADKAREDKKADAASDEVRKDYKKDYKKDFRKDYKKDFKKDYKKDSFQKNSYQKDSYQKADVQEGAAPARVIKEVVIPVKTEEEIAAMKASASKFLEGVFRAMELPVEITMEYSKEEGCLNIDFAGQDMGILIGKRGQTLDSLQYLTSLVVNKDQDGYVRVKLDTEDYRKRRKETLENLAKNIAFKVKRTRKSVSLEPMNPYERRIIHSALQGNRYVETHSEGNEPYRHVVVTYKR